MADRLTIAYFAWVRERLGREQETVEIPEQVQTVGQLIDHLLGQEGGYEAVFSDLKKLRFALDHDFVRPDEPIGNAKELAIFPPVTGG